MSTLGLPLVSAFRRNPPPEAEPTPLTYQAVWQGNVSFGTDELAKATDISSIEATSPDEIMLVTHGPKEAAFQVDGGPSVRMGNVVIYVLNATQLWCVRDPVSGASGTYSSFPPSTHYFTVARIARD